MLLSIPATTYYINKGIYKVFQIRTVCTCDAPDYISQTKYIIGYITLPIFTFKS